MREYWLVHPTDRILTIYGLHDGAFDRAEIVELKGRTDIAALPGVTIEWDPLLPHLPDDY